MCHCPGYTEMRRSHYPVSNWFLSTSLFCILSSLSSLHLGKSFLCAWLFIPPFISLTICISGLHEGGRNCLSPVVRWRSLLKAYVSGLLLVHCSCHSHLQKETSPSLEIHEFHMAKRKRALIFLLLFLISLTFKILTLLNYCFHTVPKTSIKWLHVMILSMSCWVRLIFLIVVKENS